MIFFIHNLFKFVWRINLILSYTCASSDIRDQLLKDMATSSKIMLENVNGVIERFPYVDVKKYLRTKFAKRSCITFELGPNFHYGAQFFDDIFDKTNLSIELQFNYKLYKTINQNQVQSSEIINNFMKSFPYPQNLTSLTLTSLFLTEIPKVIFKFPNLKFLNLRSNVLENFEFEQNFLENLETLFILKNTKLTAINDSICNLKSLRMLKASGCSIKIVSDLINELQNLRELDLNNNPLSEFPRVLSNLIELDSLDISYCLLKEFVINLIETPKLECIDLSYNSSLKCLKLLVPVDAYKSKEFDVKNCPLDRVEVYLNLIDSSFNILGNNDQEVSESNYDYIIKFNPSFLIKFFTSKKKSKDRFFNFYLNTSSGLRKTVLIREFNSEINESIISKNELIERWSNIYRKSRLYFKNNFDFIFEFFDKLYVRPGEVKSNITFKDYLDNEYRKKIKSTLSDLLGQMENNGKNLKFKVEDIVKIFKKSPSEQLVYLNYLLNCARYSSYKERCFIIFIKEAIEILKEQTVMACLNYDETGEEKKLKNSITNSVLEKSSSSVTEDFEEEGFDVSEERNKTVLLNELIKIIMSRKKNFASIFTLDYLSEIIYNTVNTINKPELFDNEMINFLLNNYELEPECFEYDETLGGDISIKKVNVQGVKYLICLITRGN